MNNIISNNIDLNNNALMLEEFNLFNEQEMDELYVNLAEIDELIELNELIAILSERQQELHNKHMPPAVAPPPPPPQQQLLAQHEQPVHAQSSLLPTHPIDESLNSWLLPIPRLDAIVEWLEATLDAPLPNFFESSFESVEEFLAAPPNSLEQPTTLAVESSSPPPPPLMQATPQAPKSQRVVARKLSPVSKRRIEFDEDHDGVIFLKKKQKREKKFEVEKIVGEKKENKQTFFLVKWKGYRPKHNSWVAEVDCDCNSLIEKYRKKVNQMLWFLDFENQLKKLHH